MIETLVSESRNPMGVADMHISLIDLREHSLLVIRNLLEGNAENREFVEAFKLIEGREGN